MRLSRYKVLGAGTTFCFRLRDLQYGLKHGFTDQQWAHMRECIECRRSYHMYLCISRNEAREQQGFEHIERKF